MNKRPYPITIISWIFTAFGGTGFIAGLLSLAGAVPVETITELKPEHLIE